MKWTQVALDCKNTAQICTQLAATQLSVDFSGWLCHTTFLCDNCNAPAFL